MEKQYKSGKNDLLTGLVFCLFSGAYFIMATQIAIPSSLKSSLLDASSVPVSSTLSDTLRSGGSLNIGALSLWLGEYASPMGTGAALIILACGYGVYLVDRERIDGMRRAELKRATAAAMRYDRQMAKLKAHNMRAKYRRTI